MSGQDDDATWREIVANYGDRPTLDAPDSPDQPAADPDPGVDPGLRALFGGLDDADHEPGDLAEERFVPPTPPPLPRLPADRLAAWTGVLVAPCLLLVLTVLRIDLPSILAWLLIAAFLGGFGYLIATMPRGPRDPFDDGARL